ncbi:beta-lactamase-like protein [Chytriomyces sp. MP71]|nr:beta-lactamase-like protein [Chytriomyces sp. MP71]
MDDREFIFLGTGTSSCVPNVTCVTKLPEPTCKVCLASLSGCDAYDTRIIAKRSHALVPLQPIPSRNRRNNTSALYRYRHSDGRMRNILIDAGKTFYASALQWFPHYGITQIDAVLLSHGHADAMMGLDDLRTWTLDSIKTPHGDIDYFKHEQARPSIPVYLNKETYAVVSGAFPYIVDRKKATGGGQIPALDFIVFDDKDLALSPSTPDGQFYRLKIDELDVIPFEVIHGKLSNDKPYFALGFKFPGITYISDTNEIPEKAQKLIENSEILVLDGLRDNSHPSHMGVVRSIEEALILRPKRLILTDFCHDVEHAELEARLASHAQLRDAGIEEAYPAYDGMVVSLCG